MRRSPSSATRVLTVFSLLVLCTLSFTVVYGTNNIVDPSPEPALTFQRRSVTHHRRLANAFAARDDSGEGDGGGSGSSLPTSSAASSSASPSPSSSSVPPPVSSPPPKTSKPASSSAPPSSSPTSLIPSSTTSASPSSQTTKLSTSSSDTLSSSSSLSTSSSPSPSSSPSSSSSGSSSASSSQAPSRAVQNQPTNLASPNAPALVTPSDHPFVNTDGGSTIFGPSQTASSNAAKGFFGNKSAVGGTFAAVGLLGGGLVIAAVITMMRRRRAAQRAYEDEVAYFEKPTPGNRGFETAEVGQGPLGASATSLGAMPAAPDAYPDRAIHYGGNQEYSANAYAPNTNAYAPNANAYASNSGGQDYYAGPSSSQFGATYNPNDYGIEYPPGTVFADDRAPAHAPAQGHGHADAYNPFGSDADAYGGYESHRQPSPPHSAEHGSASSHPFADPANAVRTHTPPVQYPRGVRGGYEPSVDSFYGAGAGAAS